MTTCLTIDAGIAFRLIAPHPHQGHYIAMMSRWKQSGLQLCAPTLWAYEITSAFTKMAQLGQLSAAASRDGIHMAYQLGVQLVPPDEEQAMRALAWTERLQRTAAYDSFYLALAETLGCEFWTADGRLARATGRPWVRLVEAEGL